MRIAFAAAMDPPVWAIEIPDSDAPFAPARSGAPAARCRCAPVPCPHAIPTALVADLVRQIDPVDDLEREHIADTLAWLAGTDDIFRRVKPATPSQHLVSYVVLVDTVGRGLYLGRHRKSNLNLPMGGHVEPGEHPLTAARREAAEEIGVDADFTVVGERPLMVTVTSTVGPDSHVDVSLWHVIRGDRSREYPLDPSEFDGGRWWDLAPYGLPESDPHLARFIRKLDSILQPGPLPETLSDS